jgi:hypothetical protein
MPSDYSSGPQASMTRLRAGRRKRSAGLRFGGGGGKALYLEVRSRLRGFR